MNLFTISTFTAVLGALLLTSTFSLAQDTVNNNGTLTFIYDLGEGECTMTVADKNQRAIRHIDRPTPAQPCKGNSIRYIQFNNVRSAVSIWLASEHDRWNHAIGCDYLDSEFPNNFLFELRTIKQVTNNTPIALDALTSEHVGKPVLPGVLLKSRYVKDTKRVNRHLSCIRINFD
jgi:hypothetical protein